MDGTDERRARRDENDDTIGRQRRVECQGRIVVGDHGAKTLRQQRLVGGQRIRHRLDGEARLEIGEIRQLGHEGAVDDDELAEAGAGEQVLGLARPRLGGIVGQ